MRSGSTLNSTPWLRRQATAASLVAFAAAGVAALMVPASLFQASAIVAVDEPSAALRLASSRSAADLVVSKPVIVRAAASLNGTGGSAPASAETSAVASGFVNATGAVARLADALVPTVSASAGDGLVEIKARAADGARAARVATALAEALVAEEEGLVAGETRRREAATAARLAVLRETARAARARLATLGGSESDPAEALAAAGTAVRAAEARLAAIRTVIAAGTPPLGAGSELPQTAATLQQAYWELKKQLDKASETMGERHTTVIALREGVARAAATLTAEWQRIERGAASDVTVARSREAVLRKTVNATDPAKRAAIDEARGATRLADAALARATAAPATAVLVNPPFKLIAPAGVPAVAMGAAPWQRGAISGGAGIGAFALAWLVSNRRRRQVVAGAAFDGPLSRPGAGTGTAGNECIDHAPGIAAVKPAKAPPQRWEVLAAADEASFATAVRDSDHAFDAPEIARANTRDVPFADDFAHEWALRESEETALDASDGDPLAAFEPSLTEPDALDDHDQDHDQDHDRDLILEDERDLDETGTPTSTIHAGVSDLYRALRTIAVDLDMLTHGQATTTVMVAANAAEVDTGAVALALGEAAADLGYRMLVIEAERAQTRLADAVDPEGDPMLVDVQGALRVAFPAQRGDGILIAPAFHDGGRLAAELARNGLVEVVDDLASAFDVMVVDGGGMADSAAAGWSADAFIRVGPDVSRADDAEFLEAFAASEDKLLGTVAAGRFVARDTAPEQPVAARPALRSVPTTLSDPETLAAAATVAVVRVTAPRRTTAAPPPPLLRAQARRRLVIR